jgi:hypothetical protein
LLRFGPLAPKNRKEYDSLLAGSTLPSGVSLTWRGFGGQSLAVAMIFPLVAVG